MRQRNEFKNVLWITAAAVGLYALGEFLRQRKEPPSAPHSVTITHSLQGLSATETKSSANPVPVTPSPSFTAHVATDTPKGPQMKESPHDLLSRLNPGSHAYKVAKAVREAQERATDKRTMLQRIATSDIQKSTDFLAKHGLVGPGAIINPLTHTLQTNPEEGLKKLREVRYGKVGKVQPHLVHPYYMPGGVFYDAESGAYRPILGVSQDELTARGLT